MCHADTPAGRGPSADVRTVSVPLSHGEELPAELALPDSGQGPGVLLIVDIYGCTPFYQDLSRRLAAAGYLTLMPDIFFRDGELPEVTREAALARRERMDEARSLDDLLQAARWLEDREDVQGARTGLLGFCLGGTFALDMCAERDAFAAVCYYPFPKGMANFTAPVPLDLVDRVSGPMLAFWGDRDYIDADDIRRLEDEMHRHGRDYEAIIYPGGTHGFLRGLVEDGEETEAAKDSWERTLGFFAKRLPASSS